MQNRRFKYGLIRNLELTSIELEFAETVKRAPTLVNELNSIVLCRSIVWY